MQHATDSNALLLQRLHSMYISIELGEVACGKCVVSGDQLPEEHPRRS